MGEARYVVPDTCALAAAFFSEAHSGNCAPLLAALQGELVIGVAPSIIYREFLDVCRRKVQDGSTTPARAADVVGEFLALPLLIDERLEGLCRPAWDYFLSFNLRAGDAMFYEVARQLGAELWTTDKAFLVDIASSYSDSFDLTVRTFA